MSKPVRLHKVENESSSQLIMDALEEWLLSHSLLCLFVLMALLIALFVTVIFMMVGVSATDSGLVYNQFSNII